MEKNISTQKGSETVQFESLFVDFDPRTLTKEHPFIPEGYMDDYYLFDEPEALHYHDFLELGYCVKGSGLFYVDGEVIPFSAPCCSIIYGGQIHIAQAVHQGNTEPAQPLLPPESISRQSSGNYQQADNPDHCLWHFSYINLKQLFTDTNLMQVGALKALSPHLYDFPTVIPQKDDPILYELVVSILHEAAELKNNYLTVMRGLTMALLARHSRYMMPTKNPLKLHRENHERLLDRLGSVLVYINQHYTEDITVEQLLAASKLSKSTLQRDLIAFTGMAPMQYIHHLRMKRASILLAGDLPIANVAFEVGYNSLSSFNRHFLDTFGLPPSEWKRMHYTQGK